MKLKDFLLSCKRETPDETYDALFDGIDTADGCDVLDAVRDFAGTENVDKENYDCHLEAYIEYACTKLHPPPLSVLRERGQQLIAYLDGTDAENTDHPNHEVCIFRAYDRARDIAKELKGYLQGIGYL